jgi:lysophospholipase L1-like esterase
MKRFVSLFAAAVLLFSLCSCAKNESGGIRGAYPLPKKDGLRITAFGDSIAAGYGLASQDDNYLTLFAGNIGATLKNDAVSGFDSGDLLSLLSSGSADADIKNADIVILSIGGNDILHNGELIKSTIKEAFLRGGEYFTDEINGIYSDFEANLIKIYNHIIGVNPDAAIIIQTLYNPALKQGYKIAVIDASKLIDKYISRLNESIVLVSAAFDRVVVFDVADEMNSDADNFYNLKTDFDIHPSKKGHRTLSELFTKYYEEG